MHLGRSPLLWALEGLPEPSVPPPDDFAETLVRHIRRAGEPLHTTLIQISTMQRAYVQVLGCGGCLAGSCAPGCRLRLLERVLGSRWETATLRRVPAGPSQGLAPRPYTRVYLGLPAADARPLDATLLHPWRDARLTLSWDYGRLRVPHRPAPGDHATPARVQVAMNETIRVGALLVLGEGGPADPQTVFGARNWIFWRIPVAEPVQRAWFTTPTVRPAPLRRAAPPSLIPHLLVPEPRDATEDARPDLEHVRMLPDDEAVAAHGHATAITRELEALGVRVEFLDLHPDTWTATLAAMHPDGMDPLLRDLDADHAALYVKQATTATVALRSTAALAPSMLPPVLNLGTLEGDRTRYRPISPTHHLIVSGPELPGVLAGLVAPLVDGRSDVRIGILDAADGTLARQLSGIPRRLPTAHADDEQELLGVLGQVSGAGVPVMVIVAASDAERCRKALIPLMRASAYWNVSLVMAVQSEEILPQLIRERVPILRIQHREAHIASPLGLYYEWGRKTPLRLPFRDPLQPWAGPDVAVLPTLLSPDVFWDIPAHLRAALVPDWHAAADETGAEGEEARAAGAEADAAGPGADRAAADAAADTPAADTAAPAAVSTPLLRFDAERQLIIDDQLLGPVLQRINARPNETTISVRQLRELFDLSDKHVAYTLMTALRERILVTEEVRQGHFNYLTVAEAIALERLTDGPWAVGDPAAPAPPAPLEDAAQPGDAPAAADAETQASPDPAAAAAANIDPAAAANTGQSTMQDGAPSGAPSADASKPAPHRLVPAAGLWHVTGVQTTTAPMPASRATRSVARVYAIVEEEHQ